MVTCDYGVISVAHTFKDICTQTQPCTVPYRGLVPLVCMGENSHHSYFPLLLFFGWWGMLETKKKKKMKKKKKEKWKK